ncbi:superinfection immunity protein [Pseudomonas fulva]|uniref:superinfection immunity protein n=1 Tax=Pseudomonas fulva TaxID=47880 RepID=UPI003F938691
MDEQGATGAVMVTIICAVLYFLPSMNAKSRKHPNAGSIFALNLLLGWTLIGWVVAVVWSASAVSAAAVPPHSQSPSKAEELEKLATLKERGHLSEDEFQKEKSRLLG